MHKADKKEPFYVTVLKVKYFSPRSETFVILREEKTTREFRERLLRDEN